MLDILKSTSNSNSFDENEKLFYFTLNYFKDWISEQTDIPYEISREKELQLMKFENNYIYLR